jgi:translation initiation factor IF-2
MILLQADLLELKANPDRRAKGNVIESGLEPGGPTATVLVRKGTLRVGDVVICGSYWGKVRALISEEGNRLKEAGPSVAVKVLGLNGVPRRAWNSASSKTRKRRATWPNSARQELRNPPPNPAPKSPWKFVCHARRHPGQVLKVVVKADMQGSVEAIVEALKKIEDDKVSLEVIHSAVGTITESDVLPGLRLLRHHPGLPHPH